MRRGLNLQKNHVVPFSACDGQSSWSPVPERWQLHSSPRMMLSVGVWLRPRAALEVHSSHSLSSPFFLTRFLDESSDAVVGLVVVCKSSLLFHPARLNRSLLVRARSLLSSTASLLTKETFSLTRFFCLETHADLLKAALSALSSRRLWPFLQLARSSPPVLLQRQGTFFVLSSAKSLAVWARTCFTLDSASWAALYNKCIFSCASKTFACATVNVACSSAACTLVRSNPHLPSPSTAALLVVLLPPVVPALVPAVLPAFR